MSDRDLRQLERQAVQGDVDAEGRLLLGRVRQGTVPVERLRHLALLGDMPARRALGGEWPPAPLEPGPLLAGLRPFSNRRLILLAVLAVADLGIEVWEREYLGDPRARHALVAARRWWEVVDAGGEDEGLAVQARIAGQEVFAAALEAPAAASAAGRAVSEPVATIRATGGRFLSSAEVVLQLVAAAGISLETIRRTVLGAVRVQLLASGE